MSTREIHVRPMQMSTEWNIPRLMRPNADSAAGTPTRASNARRLDSSPSKWPPALLTLMRFSIAVVAINISVIGVCMETTIYERIPEYKN